MILGTMRRFLRVLTIYVLDQNPENNVYPCTHQLYYIKVGVRRSILHGHVSIMTSKDIYIYLRNKEMQHLLQFIVDIHCSASRLSE